MKKSILLSLVALITMPIKADGIPDKKKFKNIFTKALIQAFDNYEKNLQQTTLTKEKQADILKEFKEDTLPTRDYAIQNINQRIEEWEEYEYAHKEFLKVYNLGKKHQSITDNKQIVNKLISEKLLDNDAIIYFNNGNISDVDTFKGFFPTPLNLQILGAFIHINLFKIGAGQIPMYSWYNLPGRFWYWTKNWFSRS